MTIRQNEEIVLHNVYAPVDSQNFHLPQQPDCIPVVAHTLQELVLNIALRCIQALPLRSLGRHNQELLRRSPLLVLHSQRIRPLHRNILNRGLLMTSFVYMNTLSRFLL